MTDDRRPAAMTGATGDLTPDEADEEFIPAERRGGYGSSHGRAGDDPAHAMHEPTTNPAGPPPADDPTGSDILIDPQDDRM